MLYLELCKGQHCHKGTISAMLNFFFIVSKVDTSTYTSMMHKIGVKHMQSTNSEATHVITGIFTLILLAMKVRVCIWCSASSTSVKVVLV